MAIQLEFIDTEAKGSGRLSLKGDGVEAGAERAPLSEESAEIEQRGGWGTRAESCGGVTGKFSEKEPSNGG